MQLKKGVYIIDWKKKMSNCEVIIKTWIRTVSNNATKECQWTKSMMVWNEKPKILQVGIYKTIHISLMCATEYGQKSMIFFTNAIKQTETGNSECTIRIKCNKHTELLIFCVGASTINCPQNVRVLSRMDLPHSCY